MKKILFVCDGDNFSESAFAFIRSVQAQEPVYVKGLFFGVTEFEPLIHVSYVPAAGPYVDLMRERQQRVDKSIARFTGLCREAGIKHHICDTGEEWRKDIFRKETRFADFAVMSEDLFASNLFYKQPNYFMHEALHGAECPVMLIPENFRRPEHIVGAYDGKKESMFALKQFNYLFPQFAELPVEIIYVKEEGEDEVPDLNLFREYSANYYSSQNVFRLNVDTGDTLARWLGEKKNVLLVAGSFSKPGISGLWHTSFADKPISRHIPLFIAHTC